SFDQIVMRARHLVVMDFNPSVTVHWVFDMVIRDVENCLHVKSTYKDNPHLEQGIIDKIESYEPTDRNRARGTANKWMWEVYGLGLRGKREGLVIDHFDSDRDIVKDKHWPGRHHARL